MIALLMVFFIVMYAISTVDAQKLAALASSLSQALVGSPPQGIFDPHGAGILSPEGGGQGEELSQVEAQLCLFIQRRNLEGQVRVRTEERGLMVSLAETVLFPKGSAQLTPEAHGLIKEVGQALAPLPNYLRIEGHTDDLPINTPFILPTGNSPPPGP